jgi:predicted dithiol-disulfide oxidoreductase (DUF899 family)
MVRMPDYTLEGEEGPVRLADVFAGTSQLIVYNHMWFLGEQWQCPGCPKDPTYSRWASSQDIAAIYGPHA